MSAQTPVYADDINIMVRSFLLVIKTYIQLEYMVKDIGLEIYEHKTTVMVKACVHYKLGQNVTAEGHNFEGMDGFAYLGSILARVTN
jgi:hypothetical protein